MKYFILAAGEGSRLKDEGISTPKPLLKVGNETLIDRHIRLAVTNGFSELCIVVNDLYPELKTTITSKSFDIPVHLVVKTTPSSFHSFSELKHLIDNQPLLLTTIDPFFPETRFKDFLSIVKQNPDFDGVMGLTDFVDDEKPLWVKTDDEMLITDYQSDKTNCKLVSAGFYFFKSNISGMVDQAIEQKIHKMRVFQKMLLDEGWKLLGCNIGKVIDIDHITDLENARTMIKE
jgi:NDP-sugar pyrophosphorylase family protein